MPPYNHVVHSPLWAAVGGHAEARTLELLAQQLERRRRSSDAEDADEIGAAAASHNVVQHRRHSAAGSQHGVAHQDAVLWRKPGGQFVQVLLWLRGTAALSASTVLNAQLYRLNGACLFLAVQSVKSTKPGPHSDLSPLDMVDIACLKKMTPDNNT